MKARKVYRRQEALLWSQARSLLHKHLQCIDPVPSPSWHGTFGVHTGCHFTCSIHFVHGCGFEGVQRSPIEDF